MPVVDQAGTYRVDAHAGAGQRIGRGLHQADDAGLAGAIGMAAGAGLQPATDAVQTIEPEFCATMCGIAC